MIVLPEIKIQEILEYLLSLLKTEFESRSDEKDSQLYRLFGNLEYNGYKYFEQARTIFFRPTSSDKLFKIRNSFDRTRANLPTLHITLPADQGNASDGLGYDTNYLQPLYKDNETDQFFETKSRSFQSQFNLVCTSSNVNEVQIIYYTIRALLISNVDLLELNGLRNPKISGQELVPNDNLTPGIYYRGIMLNVFYEEIIPDLSIDTLMKSATFTPTPKKDGEVTKG